MQGVCNQDINATMAWVKLFNSSAPMTSSFTDDSPCETFRNPEDEDEDKEPAELQECGMSGPPKKGGTKKPAPRKPASWCAAYETDKGCPDGGAAPVLVLLSNMEGNGADETEAGDTPVASDSDELIDEERRSWVQTLQVDYGKPLKIASPEYLTGEPEDVESTRFLGMEIEIDRVTHDWIIHQQPYVVDTLNKFCPNLILRKQNTPGDAEGFIPSQKTNDKKQVKPAETEKEPIDEASILASLLWLSLRTCPDISWAVSILASLAPSDPDESR
eukprot:533101-Amphidinium_carterae.1